MDCGFVGRRDALSSTYAANFSAVISFKHESSTARFLKKKYRAVPEGWSERDVSYCPIGLLVVLVVIGVSSAVAAEK